MAKVIGYLLSFVFLGLALHNIALSSAYAIWAGLGNAIAGFLIFDEHINVYKEFGLVFIIAGFVLLQGSKNPEKREILGLEIVSRQHLTFLANESKITLPVLRKSH